MIASSGGANVASTGALLSSTEGLVDLSPSSDDIDSLLSFIESSSFPDPIDTESLLEIEGDLIQSFFSFSDPSVFKDFSPPFSRPFDLSKPPLSYTEAVARPDAHIWHSLLGCGERS